MDDKERSDVEPTAEEAPYRSPEEVAGKAGEHEYPTMGRGGDMTGDQESLARRPPQDEDELDGESQEGGGNPRGTTRREG